jgi:hypothetical protein
LQPAVVHILAGNNDITGNTGSDFRNDSQYLSMAELAKANQIKVIYVHQRMISLESQSKPEAKK